MRRALFWAVLALAAVPVLFPLYYALVGGVMSARDLTSYPPALVPGGVHAENYAAALRTVPLGREYLNSALQSATITVFQVVTGILAAYAFAFLPMRAKAVVFGVFLSTLMVPWEAIIIPNYLAISSLGLTKGPLTYLGLVLPFLASAFGTFLLRQAFLQFPAELRDAAVVDGCGHLRFLWRILVPLAKPSIAAVGVYVFLSAWNQYFWPLILIRDPQYQTLQIGVTQLNNVEAADPGLILAGVSMALLPTLVIVIFGQRFIVRGLTAGAVR
jgi:sn-glycerol 3-phosphate transport system permease protein